MLDGYYRPTCKSKNAEITNPKTKPRPMKCYKNYLINRRGLAKCAFGKTPNGVIGEKRNLSFRLI